MRFCPNCGQQTPSGVCLSCNQFSNPAFGQGPAGEGSQAPPPAYTAQQPQQHVMSIVLPKSKCCLCDADAVFSCSNCGVEFCNVHSRDYQHHDNHYNYVVVTRMRLCGHCHALNKSLDHFMQSLTRKFMFSFMVCMCCCLSSSIKQSCKAEFVSQVKAYNKANDVPKEICVTRVDWQVRLFPHNHPSYKLVDSDAHEPFVQTCNSHFQ